MKLVWKLLRQHISLPQFTGFFIANVIGMTIILTGIQFYKDIQAIYNGGDSFMNEQYLIVNKKVSTLGSVTGNNNSFSADELQEIKNQPFIKRFATFTPSSFPVKAGFNMEGIAHFSTEMFFETVPDEFVDVASDKWKFNEDDLFIPIIIPKSYLDLYNFGFAQSRNMPNLSEGVLSTIQLDVTIKNGFDNDVYHGKIVGFSNRLNTILVPETFMQYANQKYAKGRETSVSRVIFQVDNPTDERITSFLQDKGYETDQSKLDASKTTFILRMLVTIVLIIGLAISLLAFFILMLSIYLLVEKNNTKLENLLLIGYSPSKVAWPYQLLTIIMNLSCALIASLLMLMIRNIYIELLEDFFPDMDSPTVWVAVIVGLTVMIVMSLANVLIIKNKVVSIWRKE